MVVGECCWAKEEWWLLAESTERLRRQTQNHEDYYGTGIPEGCECLSGVD